MLQIGRDNVHRSWHGFDAGRELQRHLLSCKEAAGGFARPWSFFQVPITSVVLAVELAGGASYEVGCRTFFIN